MWREAISVTMGFRFQTELLHFKLYDDHMGGKESNNGQFYPVKQHRDNMSSYTSSSWPTGMKKLN